VHAVNGPLGERGSVLAPGRAAVPRGAFNQAAHRPSLKNASGKRLGVPAPHPVDVHLVVGAGGVAGHGGRHNAAVVAAGVTVMLYTSHGSVL
jgi:hypothetical protein